MVPNAGGNTASTTIRLGRPVGALIAARLLAVALAGAGCHADAAVSVGPPAQLQRVSGSGQSAAPGAELDRPLVARLVDAGGRPVRRAEVRWSATAGEVTPAVSTTNANGDARAVWRLGTGLGIQRAIAEANGLDPIEFVAFVDPEALPDRVSLRAVSLDTYDGSGQVVHPDIVTPAAPGALDERDRLVATPYPWGNAGTENPSLFVGNGRDAWRVPDDVTNPIVRPAGGGYLSDPDIVWVPDRRELWLYYRQVRSENEILLTRSSDGVGWTTPLLVVRAPNHDLISPTIVRRAPDDWLMWSVNGGAEGCGASTASAELRRSSDGESWSRPHVVSLSQPGVFPWHIEVQWLPSLGEYWALFNGKVAGSCTTQALYVATSSDGVTWRTFRSPVLRRAAIPELADIVYRATFSYDAQRDLVSLWYSGARYTSRGYEWHAAFERVRRADMFDRAARADAMLVAPSSAPPLDNSTAP